MSQNQPKASPEYWTELEETDPLYTRIVGKGSAVSGAPAATAENASDTLTSMMYTCTTCGGTFLPGHKCSASNLFDRDEPGRIFMDQLVILDERLMKVEDLKEHMTSLGNIILDLMGKHPYARIANLRKHIENVLPSDAVFMGASAKRGPYGILMWSACVDIRGTTVSSGEELSEEECLRSLYKTLMSMAENSKA